MSLQAALTLFLEEYPKAVSRSFAGDSVARFVRDDVPQIIGEKIDTSRYLVEGSAGQGRWARVPWVAVFDRLVTESAQNGFYVVYLVKEDFSGVYLSLNQGVTTVKERYGADAKRALRARADDFQARLGRIPDGFTEGSIDLATDSSASLGSFYEAGAIFSRYYDRTAVPDDAQLFADLERVLRAYLVLTDRELPPPSAPEREDDEVGLEYEDTGKIRLHKRIERNQRLAKRVKALKGLKCEACQFTYSQGYRGLNTDYIEAHHLIPLSDLGGGKVRMDPLRDFAVLCANCHRMIHRSSYISDVEAFRQTHLAPRE